MLNACPRPLQSCISPISCAIACAAGYGWRPLCAVAWVECGRSNFWWAFARAVGFAHASESWEFWK